MTPKNNARCADERVSAQFAADNEKLIQESDARIKQYEEEIRNILAVMQQSVYEQQNLMKVCNVKKLEVQQVVEFFGQDKVVSVVKASPKLHDQMKRGRMIYDSRGADRPNRAYFNSDIWASDVSDCVVSCA